MNRKQLIGGIILSALAALGASIPASTQHPESGYETRNNSDQQGQPSATKTSPTAVVVAALPTVEIKRDWLQIYLTLAWIIVTAIGAGIATLAFWNERKAVRLTQRADILLDSVGLTNGRKLDRNSAVTLAIKNFGPTRADNVNIDVSLSLPGPLEETPSDEFSPAVIVLGAGEPQTITFKPIHQFMDKKTGEGIIAGTIPLIFSGTISYEDVFGEPHTTTFAGRWRKEAGFFEITRRQSS